MSKCQTCKKEAMKKFFPADNWDDHSEEIEEYVKEQRSIMLGKVAHRGKDFKKQYRVYLDTQEKKLEREAQVRIAERLAMASLECKKCKGETEPQPKKKRTRARRATLNV